jgi:ABC-type uncharacterized transport system auxiliary subunit
MTLSFFHLSKMSRILHGLSSLATPKWTLVPCVILAVLLTACGSRRPIKYYEVSFPSKAFVAPDAINAALMVRPFESNPLYLDEKIVYGFDSPEMGTYEYSRWVNSPVEIMEMALVRGLRAAGHFQAVYTMRSDPNSRFTLGGHLYDFKEVDSSNVVARLTYVVYLRDRKTSKTVWDYSYTHDEPATEKSINAFVNAMDKNIQRSVQEIDSGLEQYFRANPVQ